MAKKPTVSVIIPAYNSEKTIGRAIDSVVAQTYRAVEIFVVDDCSDDSTKQIVESYSANGVKLLALSARSGVSAARNAGIEAASADLVAFLDSDDEWLATKLAKQVRLIASDARLALVSCGSKLISPDGVELGDTYRGLTPVTGDRAWKALLSSNFIATPTVVAWRHLLVALGGFDRTLKIGEDQDMWIRLALAGELGYVNEYLVHVHQRELSLSAGHFEDQLRYTLPMIERHLDSLGGRLTKSEESAIRGARLSGLGHLAHSRGETREAIRMILRSLALGHRPLFNIYDLVSILPPVRRLKPQVRRWLGVGAQAKPSMGNISPGRALLPGREDDLVHFPKDMPPQILVIVDAEEEFDWSQPFSRANPSVKTMSVQFRAQEIFARFGIIPTYVVDYPVASQADGYMPLLEFVQSGHCEVGAQLHSWVTPPYEEEICERNSFAGNLPPSLELRKIEQLTDTIQNNFSRKPLLYRAGRFGAGFDTTSVLEELGYRLDCSVLPGYRSATGGPDYSGGVSHPYWLQPSRSVLEIPVTVATVGVARNLGGSGAPGIFSPMGQAMRLPGVMSRTGLASRIRLTPEGTTLSDAKKLTSSMVRDGHRLFVVTYHSPSLAAGHTPYVRTQEQLSSFLGWLEGYMDFFFGEIRGKPTTPIDVWDSAQRLRSKHAENFWLSQTSPP